MSVSRECTDITESNTVFVYVIHGKFTLQVNCEFLPLASSSFTDIYTTHFETDIKPAPLDISIKF
jgi:hypothetical protein